MQNYEIILRKGNPYPYIVRKNDEVCFEGSKFVHAGLYVSIGIMKAYDSREKVKIVYDRKISERNRSKLDGLIKELWGKKTK